MENQNTNKKKDSYIDLMVEKVKKILNYAETKPAVFGTIITFLISTVLWVIKGMWYAYQSGRFSVYGIDKCYINTDNDSILLQVLFAIAIAFVGFFINAFFYIVVSYGNNTKSKIGKFKRIRNIARVIGKIVVLLIIEMIILYIFEMVYYGFDIKEAVVGLKDVRNIVIVFCTCVIINLFGIVFSIQKIFEKEERDEESNKNQNDNHNNQSNDIERKGVEYIVALICIIAFEMIFIFIYGKSLEQDRSEYKVIVYNVSYEDTEKYSFIDYAEKQKFIVYPIVYENSNSYIVTRLLHNKKSVVMDYSYQKVIKKDGITTFDVMDYKNIEIERMKNYVN